MSLYKLSHLLQVFDLFKCITYSRTVTVSFWFCLFDCLFVYLLVFFYFFVCFFMDFLFTKKIYWIIFKEFKCSVLDRELDKGHRCRFVNFAVYKRTCFTTERHNYACENQNFSFYNLHHLYFFLNQQHLISFSYYTCIIHFVQLYHTKFP